MEFIKGVITMDNVFKSNYNGQCFQVKLDGERERKNDLNALKIDYQYNKPLINRID